MDARLLKVAVFLSAFSSLGATYRTPNFTVNAESEDVAKQVALTAERCRDELAVEWLGKKLPRWFKPCDVNVSVGQVGAGGATSFAFDRGEVFGWRMRVQGTLERILDSVIPHEVTHTILACHFRRPLPRWADEGAATLVEHESEQRRQQLTLKQVFDTPRRIPLKNLLAIKEYPSDMQDVLTLYAQGYSLADFLVQKGGKQAYLKFLNDAHKNGWDAAIKHSYSFSNISALEKEWSGWVIAGSPALDLPEGQQLADAGNTSSMPRSSTVVFRSQSPDEKPTVVVTPDLGELKARPEGLAAPDLHVPAGRVDKAAETKAAEHTKTDVVDLSSRDINQNDAALANGGDAGQPSKATEDESSRLPRPNPLVLRQTLPTPRNEPPQSRPAKFTPNQPQDLDQPQGRAERTDVGDARNHPAEEQELASRRSPEWSGFPQQRTKSGPTRLGIASADPVSP